MQTTGENSSDSNYSIEKVERSERQLRQLFYALCGCNRAVSEAEDLDLLFSIVCDAISSCDNLHLACIGRISHETEPLLAISLSGFSINHCHSHSIEIADLNSLLSFLSLPRRLKQSIWIADTGSLGGESVAELHLMKTESASLAVLPISATNDITRALVIYSKVQNAFTLEIKRFLEEVSLILGIAIELVGRRVSNEQAKREADYLGKFDPLTELPNRAFLQDKVEEFIRLSTRNGSNFAMVFLDLDHFKDVNDSLGHFAGDQLLRSVSVRLKGCIRQDDIVARFGGDEFVLLLRDVCAKKAAKIIVKILATVSKLVNIEDTEIHPTCSIGVSIFPADGTDMATLCRNADAAMYQAKHAGRNRFCYFTAQMQAQSMRQVKLASALRHALELNQFLLNYQAQVSIEEGRIVGAEALLRWYHPELGSVSPQEFIPICEETGLIGSIGEWVIRQATRHANIWLAKGLGPIVVSVNMSPAQFRNNDLPMVVSAILSEEGLLPDYLEFELTESLAMNDPETAILTMDMFAKKGLRMSIDDFGTGYSSLSYLKKFKVSKLKIDKSFVQDITDNAEDAAIVRAIIQMASSLGMITIAEGVETHEQLSFLYENGCAEFQGYLVNKPMPAEEFEVFLRKSVHVWDDWKPGVPC